MYENLFEWPTYIGLIVFVIIVSIFIFKIRKSPKKIKIAINREIEENIKGEGFVLSEKYFLDGLGSPRAGALDIEDFIKTAKDLGVKWIFYAFYEIDNKLQKKYWASISEGVILEYKEVYSPEKAENIYSKYSVEEYGDEEVVFKKEVSTYAFVSAILTGFIFGFIAGFIVLVLQILCEWIF